MAKKNFAYKFKGADKILKGITKAKVEILATQVEAVQLSTLLVHETAVKSIQTVSGSKADVRYNPKRTVVVSNPGTPPNTDTGRAVQSVKFDFKNQGLIGRVGTNLKYLAQLEFGTKYVVARPWLSLALTNSKEGVKKIFRDVFKKTMKKRYGG